MRTRWSREDLESAVAASRSVRQVIVALGLVPAGGNYEQVKKYIAEYRLDTRHFLGQAWNRGRLGGTRRPQPLEKILRRGSRYQSYKLKRRLFAENIKTPKCEICGWAKMSEDGRIPLELDHINGDRYDNRLSNLRILCPNCHSLQPTHRGKNKHRRGGGIGRHATLKMS